MQGKYFVRYFADNLVSEVPNSEGLGVWLRVLRTIGSQGRTHDADTEACSSVAWGWMHVQELHKQTSCSLSNGTNEVCLLGGLCPVFSTDMPHDGAALQWQHHPSLNPATRRFSCASCLSLPFIPFRQRQVRGWGKAACGVCVCVGGSVGRLGGWFEFTLKASFGWRRWVFLPSSLPSFPKPFRNMIRENSLPLLHVTGVSWWVQKLPKGVEARVKERTPDLHIKGRSIYLVLWWKTGLCGFFVSLCKYNSTSWHKSHTWLVHVSSLAVVFRVGFTSPSFRHLPAEQLTLASFCD